jgi:hypothetical protein
MLQPSLYARRQDTDCNELPALLVRRVHARFPVEQEHGDRGFLKQRIVKIVMVVALEIVCEGYWRIRNCALADWRARG